MNPTKHGGWGDQGVLPDSDHRPTGAAKEGGDSAVSAAVCLYFLRPECLVPARRTIAAWAAMPEAAVNEDGEPLLSEREVWLSRDRIVAAPADDARLAKAPCECKLGSPISTTPNRGHDSCAGGCGGKKRVSLLNRLAGV